MESTMESMFEHEHSGRSEGERPGGRGPGIEFQCLEFCPICRTADVVRATMPEEFREHWHTVQRESLLAMRALLDHYIQHLEQQRTSSVPVEDIPIE
jgi:hypothetical protein